MCYEDLGWCVTYRSPEALRALLLDRDTVSDQASHVQDLQSSLIKVGLLCSKVGQ